MHNRNQNQQRSPEAQPRRPNLLRIVASHPMQSGRMCIDASDVIHTHEKPSQPIIAVSVEKFCMCCTIEHSRPARIEPKSELPILSLSSPSQHSSHSDHLSPQRCLTLACPAFSKPRNNPVNQSNPTPTLNPLIINRLPLPLLSHLAQQAHEARFRLLRHILTLFYSRSLAPQRRPRHHKR